jgi:hypothetical protein
VWVRPTGALFPLYLGGTQKYLEFDGINLDASSTEAYNAIRIEAGTGGGSNQTDHIRVQNAEVIGVVGAVTILLQAYDAASAATGGNEFINLTVHGGGMQGSIGGHAFYIQSSNNTIANCDISDTTGAAVHIYTGYGFPVSNTIVKNNVIHDMRVAANLPTEQLYGIIVWNGEGTGTTIFNNRIYHLPKQGVSVSVAIYAAYGSAIGIYNNTVVSNSGQGLVTVAGTGATGTIQNNIFYDNALGNYDNGAGFTADHNLTGVDPSFVDATNGNYQLAQGSTAIDYGTPVAVVTTDLLGIARPQGNGYDAGAYEYSSVPQSPPPPPTNEPQKYKFRVRKP